MEIALAPPLPSALAEKQSKKERHWTVEEFYKAYDTGVFEYSKRFELIQGRIVEKMQPGPHHSALADIIAQMLRDAMQPPFIVREEKVIHLASDTELIPDIMVARGFRTDYLERHPTPSDVVLLVEVADTTAVRDLGEKALLYAQAGITDYWVMLVNEADIVRYREPTPEGYSQVVRLARTNTLSPLAAPEVVWTVDALLSRPEGGAP